jgi:hypothetical protein
MVERREAPAGGGEIAGLRALHKPAAVTSRATDDDVVDTAASLLHRGQRHRIKLH